ncbi:peroxiredoxin [Acrasis kona]|uniref:Peroxiredoxin n=1 Tax=Acrasis kona TaxID=1008807 RepID=A0AAW2Z099_9EUKA
MSFIRAVPRVSSSLLFTSRMFHASPMFLKQVPDVTFRTRVRDETVQGPNPFKWKDVTSNEVFKGKKIVVLGLPGAFTPTCSSTHLPAYEEHYEDFKKLGVDEIYCVSVNDAFVMFQWGKSLGVNKVKLLPDGNGEFSKGVNMLVKKSNLGFGERSWRYSMLVEDGEIKKQFVEENQRDDADDDPFTVSDAKTMLNYLKEQKQ